MVIFQIYQITPLHSIFLIFLTLFNFDSDQYCPYEIFFRIICIKDHRQTSDQLNSTMNRIATTIRRLSLFTVSNIVSRIVATRSSPATRVVLAHLNTPKQLFIRESTPICQHTNCRVLSWPAIRVLSAGNPNPVVQRKPASGKLLS